MVHMKICFQNWAKKSFQAGRPHSTVKTGFFEIHNFKLNVAKRGKTTVAGIFLKSIDYSNLTALKPQSYYRVWLASTAYADISWYEAVISDQTPYNVTG